MVPFTWLLIAFEGAIDGLEQHSIFVAIEEFPERSREELASREVKLLGQSFSPLE